MKEKLLELMKNEDLRPGQLAELLGVNPAGISHILAGRNKPGFDLLQKILNRFPNINPDWLILDKGSMYRDDAATEHTASEKSADNPMHSVPQPITPQPTDSLTADAATSTTPTSAHQFSNLSNAHGKVRKIVILYEDGTFESFSPMQ